MTLLGKILLGAMVISSGGAVVTSSYLSSKKDTKIKENLETSPERSSGEVENGNGNKAPKKN